MAASLQPTSSKTTIFDLNGDCLKEVFAHMNPQSLTTVADVCSRFKQNIKEEFAHMNRGTLSIQNTMHAALLTIKEIRLYSEPSMYDYSMLRNFGEFIEKIEVRGHYVEKRIIQHLSLYCVGKSIELGLENLRITDEIAILMRPLLGRVQKLQFNRCRLDDILLQNLPLWSTGLLEPEYGASKPVNVHEKQFDYLRRENLKSISFERVPDVENEELLQQNRQLEEIELIYCGSLDSCVFESIARNVPTIEKIRFIMCERKPNHWDYAKYFRQFRELMSLTLGAHGDDSYMQSVVHEIASVNTCLGYLDLWFFDLHHNADQFIGGISKLQQLKDLRLNLVENLTAAHLIEICKHAKELSFICLYGIVTNMTITKDDLSKIVNNARKLQVFKWSDDALMPDAFRTNIDGNIFLKLAKLVDQRDEKTKLYVYLPHGFFNLTIPADLLAAVNNLEIKIW